MAEQSKIEWTNTTWNPVVGCTKVSPGCDHCYAETLVNRFAGHNKGFPNTFDVVTLRGDGMLLQPIRWKRGRRIFVNSLSDLFHDDIPAAFIARVFGVMAVTPQHTYQVLTKRHGRMRSLLNSEHFRDDAHSRAIDYAQRLTDEPAFTWPLPNVWLGVSVEDQHWADVRIPVLLDTPAAVRFLSCEPLLGPVSLDRWVRLRGGLSAEPLGIVNEGIGWVIVGGESGHGYRTVDAEWVRDLRNECVSAGVPFLFKQWGGRTSKAGGRELDGQTWDQYPQISSPAATLL